MPRLLAFTGNRPAASQMTQAEGIVAVDQQPELPATLPHPLVTGVASVGRAVSASAVIALAIGLAH
jgi:hypothetical protein